MNMELRGGVEIPIALWGGLERRMGTMTRVLQAARNVKDLNRLQNYFNHKTICNC